MIRLFSCSQEYLPEILKREQDLKVFKLLRKLSGHASSKENWEEKKNEEEGVDELLVSSIILVVIVCCCHCLLLCNIA